MYRPYHDFVATVLSPREENVHETPPDIAIVAPSHLHEALGDIRATNQRVVQALEERAAATREELTQVRETRLRLRSSRMPERTTTSSVLDREG